MSGIPLHLRAYCDAMDRGDHDFRGYRAFEDGRGGEQVCTKCGMGAMEHSLREGI
jgi:hypothetical protein